MNIIRVFPRRTSLTPLDDFAFVGDPPLWRPPADEVHISVAFTWDLEEGGRLAHAWGQYYPLVKLGGPALGSPVDTFTPGLYVKDGVTFTSRGCNKKCPWCLVPLREGRIQLLPIQQGWIVNDNNLLQCPRDHQAAVYAMLRHQRRAAKFSGGLDATLVDDWVAEQLSTVPIHEVFLAADTARALNPLHRAVERLSFLSRNQLRCYVLIGFRGECIEDAENRLEQVWDAGCLPFAQLYQPPDRLIHYPQEWQDLARRWSRPAATKAMQAATQSMKGGGDRRDSPSPDGRASQGREARQAVNARTSWPQHPPLVKAICRENPVVCERAIAAEKPNTGERAMETKKPVDIERATVAEKPRETERAICRENPIEQERASSWEKPMGRERAIVSEKPNTGERANRSEKSKWDERAIRIETPNVGERATSLENPKG